MPHFLQTAPLPLALGLSAGAAAVAIWRLMRRPPSAAARERSRRLAVAASGRVADATLLDVEGDQLHYTYTVRGVQYSAAQDISVVRELLPAGETSLVGPALVKYTPGNPANSIVISEAWSGVRLNPKRSLP